MIAVQVTRPSITPSPAIVRYADFPRRPCHHQQVRGFRFGHWSSYLDSALQKELQRQHHILKHKCAEALSKKLAWNRRLPAHVSHWRLKSFMCSSWHASDPRPSGRHVNSDELNGMTNDSSPNKNGGIEDVEQPALDKLRRYQEARRLLWSDRSSSWTLVEAESTPADPLRAMNSARPDSLQRHNTKHVSTTEEYDIDPISNRKIFRKNTAKKEPQLQTRDPNMLDIPVKKFKGYKSQLSKFSPPIEKEPEQQIHFDGDPSTCPEEQAQLNSKYGQGEFVQYKPFTYSEPDGKSPEKPDLVAEGLKEYDDRHEHEPFMHNEPDGKAPEKPDQVAEGLKKYDQDHEYKPFMYNEPDGKPPERLDLAERGSGGKLAGTNSGNTTVNTTFDANCQMSKAPVENTIIDSPASGSRRLSQEIYSSDAKGSSEGDFPSNLSAPSNKSQVYSKRDDKSEDLDLLRASDVRAASGIIKEPRKETKSEKEIFRASLEADFYETQRPGKTFLSKEALQDKESRQIAIAFEIERSYLRNFIAHAKGHIETAKTELKKTADKTERGYLLKCLLHATERMEARRAQLEELEKNGRPSNQFEIKNWQSDARQAGMATRPEDLNRLTWNFSRDFPEEFITSWAKKGSSSDDSLAQKKDSGAWGYDKAPKRLEGFHQQEVGNTVQSAENDHATHTAVDDKFPKETSSVRLESALNRSLKAKETAKPAEYDLYTKEPVGLGTSSIEEIQGNEISGSPIFVSSYGCEKQGPSLVESSDRSPKAPIKTEEEILDEELVQEIRGIYETAYGIIDNEHRQPVSDSISSTQASQLSNEGQATSSPPDLSPPEPTLYKILAYDPSMQAINAAETTSIVTDTSAALTPAEVLIRLTNPAKFFPHFKPLQAQGYEIVSGSGDVLVFRKVREEVAAVIVESTTSTSTTPTPPQQVVNPIDGMQRFPNPATGNFASPTGFVNHDLPHEDRFISGIDVRREEPVFSGQKSAWHDGQDTSDNFGRKPKKSRKRALLFGAAWVAACSYAVGVVAEYFKTGGSDGKGPTGF